MSLKVRVYNLSNNRHSSISLNECNRSTFGGWYRSVSAMITGIKNCVKSDATWSVLGAAVIDCIQLEFDGDNLDAFEIELSHGLDANEVCAYVVYDDANGEFAPVNVRIFERGIPFGGGLGIRSMKFSVLIEKSIN